MNKKEIEKQGSAARLIEVLRQYGEVETEVWLGEGFNKNCKWDAVWHGPDGTIYVEFDGPFHYQKPTQIFRDGRKTACASAEGVKLVRFPYWLAVDAESIKHFFGLETNAPHDFPHGFPSTGEVPSSFCEKGITNFEHDLQNLSSGLREAVLYTLRCRAEKIGAEWILPSSLQHLL